MKFTKRNLALSMMCIGFSLLIGACAGSVATHNNAGNQYFYREDFEDALQAYQSAQVIAPDRPEAYFNGASALAGLDNMPQAAESLKQALLNADNNLKPNIYFNLGNVYFQMGLYAEAIEAYQQGLLIDPDDDDMRYNLEIALLRYIPPTPTAQEQKTEPEVENTDPETTPTNQPAGFDGPTPTPLPLDVDLSATPIAGQGSEGEVDSLTPIPQSEGELTVEQAEHLFEQIQQDQQALSEYLQNEAASGETTEKDW